MKKEYFSIPNIMSYFRILLIPVDGVVLLLLFFPSMPLVVVNLLIALAMISMILTMVMYVIFHYRLLHNMC